MISLNGVILSGDFLWINRYSEASSILSLRRTISGTAVIQQAQLTGGINITFGSVAIASGYSGWFTKTQIDAIKVLESSGEIVTFIYEDFQFKVIVMPESINVEPLIPRPNSDANDIFVGTVSLITV